MSHWSARRVPQGLCLIGLYITVEETLVKWAFGSGALAAIVRQVPDLLVIGFAAVLMALRLLELRVPRFSSAMPLWLGLFAAYGVIVIAASDGDVLYSLLNLKAFLRYTMLFVLLHYFPFDEGGRRFLRRSITVAVGIQAVVCVWQLWGGESVRDLLVPADIESADPRFGKFFTGARFEGVNDLVGTMGNNIGLSYFLVIVLAFWLAVTPGRLARLCGAVALLGWNAFTGSRAGLLASVIIVLVYESRGLTTSARIFVAAAATAVLVAVLLSISGDAEKGSLLYVFNSGYIEEATNQRLGLVLYLLPELVFSPVVFTGLGPDKYLYPSFFEQIGIQLPWVLMAVLPNIIEDVYWIAIVASYGMFGAALFATALLTAWAGLGRVVNSPTRSDDWVAHAGRLLIIASLVLALFSQVYHLRQFSYFFWLLIGVGLQAPAVGDRSDVARHNPTDWK